MSKLVLVRHGQSLWNKANRFTGWVDIDLSEQGVKEANEAGEYLKAEGIDIDIAFTSYLKRAVKTCWAVLEKTERHWIPVHKAWQLNERNYGALQGLNKKETAEKHGADQVFNWRRGFDVFPPALETSNDMHPSHDPRYKNIPNIPSCESLKTTGERVIPYWTESILPTIESGKNVLVAAHGNSLRSLLKHLENISDEDIAKINVPTGKPIVFNYEGGKLTRTTEI